MAAAAAAGVAVASGTGVATAAPDGVLHVTVLDVGAAPAVLVQSGSGALALIDGGASAPLLLQALGRATPPWTRHIGLVVLTCGTFGNVLRFLPPLVIGEGLLEEGLSILEDSFAAL